MKKKYYEKFDEILITKEEISKAITKAAKWVDDTYKDVEEPVILIGLLKGCIPFLGQLLTQIEREVVLDFMVVSSYKGTDKRVNKPEIVTDIISNVENKHVLFVEDIVDSGYTIKHVMERIKKDNPASVKLISLVNKPGGRRIDIEADYYCFEVENKWVTGFGFDVKEQMRNYEFIGVLKKEFLK